MRAPLRAIDGFSRILIDDHSKNLPAEAQEYLRDVRTSTQQMGKLVDDLLAFSRLGRLPINRQLVHVRTKREITSACWDYSWLQAGAV